MKIYNYGQLLKNLHLTEADLVPLSNLPPPIDAYKMAIDAGIVDLGSSTLSFIQQKYFKYNDNLLPHHSNLFYRLTDISYYVHNGTIVIGYSNVSKKFYRYIQYYNNICCCSIIMILTV